MQTRSGTAQCGDVELYYEELGDPADPAVLLIMGVGAQLPMWPDAFCAMLVERGYRVIRYDHRDIGLSTKLTGQRANGSVYARVARYAVGRGRPRLARPAWDRAGARRRGVDGRHDRADPGGQPSR